ncbi:hypothetical protein BT69DRAFT_27901 [Atractiella rhizophila]|nr:hypothetical protein BT69DRAFT_27901 [Atractiella rhizophila]
MITKGPGRRNRKGKTDVMPKDGNEDNHQKRRKLNDGPSRTIIVLLQNQAYAAFTMLNPLLSLWSAVSCAPGPHLDPSDPSFSEISHCLEGLPYPSDPLSSLTGSATDFNAPTFRQISTVFQLYLRSNRGVVSLMMLSGYRQMMTPPYEGCAFAQPNSFCNIQPRNPSSTAF